MQQLLHGIVGSPVALFHCRIVQLVAESSSSGYTYSLYIIGNMVQRYKKICKSAPYYQKKISYYPFSMAS